MLLPEPLCDLNLSAMAYTAGVKHARSASASDALAYEADKEAYAESEALRAAVGVKQPRSGVGGSVSLGVGGEETKSADKKQGKRGGGQKDRDKERERDTRAELAGLILAKPGSARGFPPERRAQIWRELLQLPYCCAAAAALLAPAGVARESSRVGGGGGGGGPSEEHFVRLGAVVERC